jgi:hypothetical protein
MTGQEQVDKPNKAMICDCDKYGHAHSAAGEIEPFRIRIEVRCVNGLSADRFGHACLGKIAMAGNPDLYLLRFAGSVTNKRTSLKACLFVRQWQIASCG